jgi:hypothetical protein
LSDRHKARYAVVRNSPMPGQTLDHPPQPRL